MNDIVMLVGFMILPVALLKILAIFMAKGKTPDALVALVLLLIASSVVIYFDVELNETPLGFVFFFLPVPSEALLSCLEFYLAWSLFKRGPLFRSIVGLISLPFIFAALPLFGPALANNFFGVDAYTGSPSRTYYFFVPGLFATGAIGFLAIAFLGVSGSISAKPGGRRIE